MSNLAVTSPTHIVIPDLQIAPGTPTVHLEWIGQYVHDKYGDRAKTSVIQLGDAWDFPSLSWYDRGKKSMEGRRLALDIEAGNAGMELLSQPFSRDKLNRIILRGNHEDRLTRAIEDHAQLEGVLDFSMLNDRQLGWSVQEYQEVFMLDGVAYSHYFYNPMTGRPYGGQNVETRLKTIGSSFTMGHQQGLLYGLRNVLGGLQHGMVAGSCYLHDEDYKGPQGNAHWRGIIVCHNVERGSYDPKFVSLDSLCRRYEGMRLSRYISKRRWRK